MKFKIKQLPLFTFLVFCLKVLLISADVYSVSALAILGVVAFLYEFKSIDAEFDELKSSVDSKLNDLLLKIQEQDKKLEENRQFISSMKIQGAVKGNSPWQPNR